MKKFISLLFFLLLLPVMALAQGSSADPLILGNLTTGSDCPTYPCFHQYSLTNPLYISTSGGSGGSVSITAATPNVVVTPSPIVGTGTVGLTQLINAQGSAASYVIVAGDMGKTVTHSRGSSVAVTLPQAGTTGFATGVSYTEINLGAGTVTITPTTSTINGASSYALTQGQGIYIVSDGTNYIAFTGAGGTGSGTVNSGTATQVGVYSSTGTAISGSSLLSASTTGVGIGTTTPAHALTVSVGASADNTAFSLDSTTSNGTSFAIGGSGTGVDTWNFLSEGASNSANHIFAFYDSTSNRAPLALIGNTSAISLAGVLCWNGTNFAGTCDAGISRTGSSAFAIGNSVAGNASGSLALATISLGGVLNYTTTSAATGIGAGVHAPANSAVALTTSGIDRVTVSATGNTTLTSALVSGGTKFTASGCSNGTTVGGATAGQFASGTTGACTVVITMNGATGATAPNGWSCAASDITTPANLISQSATSTTTCTITGTTVSGDTITFHAMAY